MSQDRIYREPEQQIVDFAFDDKVSAVFPDMIRRSVPGYELVVPMMGLLAARAMAGGARPIAYDLGCSLGAVSLATLRAADALAREQADVRIHAVDSAAPMIERARSLVDDPRITFREADIRRIDLEPCGAVTMSWVLQFLPPDDRLDMLRRVHAALDAAGVLLVAEKIRFEDPDEEAFCDAAHLDFKRANGYSELEISGKRSALERVMLVDPIATHLERFSAAGFTGARTWFTCLNWAAFVVTP